MGTLEPSTPIRVKVFSRLRPRGGKHFTFCGRVAHETATPKAQFIDHKGTGEVVVFASNNLDPCVVCRCCVEVIKN